MKIKALVTALLLATSTAAMAAPAYQPEIRDHRMPQRPIDSWSVIGSGTMFRGKAYVSVKASRIEKLKLESTRGNLYVDKLIVTFANGRSQTIEVGKTVSQWGATVDLNGRNRNVTSVQVIGRGTGFRAGGSFKLLALG